jgi:hypothetical protein
MYLPLCPLMPTAMLLRGPLKQYGIATDVWQHGIPALDSPGGREGGDVTRVEAGSQASTRLQMCEVWPISLRRRLRCRPCRSALDIDIVVRGSMNEHLICGYCRHRIDLRRDNYLLMQKREGSSPMTDVAAHLTCHEEQRPPRVDAASRP